MNSQQKELINKIEEDLYGVFDPDFIAQVNKHFGTNITATHFSQREAHGSDRVGPTGYSGPDSDGAAGFTLAEQIARAIGCDPELWNRFNGRGKRGRMAIESVRRRLSSDQTEVSE